MNVILSILLVVTLQMNDSVVIPTVHEEAHMALAGNPVTEVIGKHGERQYYHELGHKFGMGDLFNGISIPTNFGIGFIPDPEAKEKFAYYSAMFLQFRYRKSYGWYFEAGLDQHNHSYRDFSVAINDRNINVRKGMVNNMQLIAGGGYRFPLVKDFREFLDRPYLNRWNLSLMLAIGGAWTTLSQVEVIADESLPAELREADRKEIIYDLKDQNYFYPVMKMGWAVECFTGNRFSIFISMNYMQHLMRQPWDTPNMTGTLSFGLGFGGFFDGNP